MESQSGGSPLIDYTLFSEYLEVLIQLHWTPEQVLSLADSIEPEQVFHALD